MFIGIFSTYYILFNILVTKGFNTQIYYLVTYKYPFSDLIFVKIIINEFATVLWHIKLSKSVSKYPSLLVIIDFLHSPLSNRFHAHICRSSVAPFAHFVDHSAFLCLHRVWCKHLMALYKLRTRRGLRSAQLSSSSSSLATSSFPSG